MKIRGNKKDRKQGKIMMIVGFCFLLFGVFSIWTGYFRSDFSTLALTIGLIVCGIGLTVWSGGKLVLLG